MYHICVWDTLVKRGDGGTNAGQLTSRLKFVLSFLDTQCDDAELFKTMEPAGDGTDHIMNLAGNGQSAATSHSRTAKSCGSCTAVGSLRSPRR
jgi:hypothetical protein